MEPNNKDYAIADQGTENYDSELLLELDPFRDYKFENTQRFDPKLIHVEGCNVFYRGRIGIDPMGSYMGGHKLCTKYYYVCFDVVDIWPGDNMSVGLCSNTSPLNKHIGQTQDSIGLHAIDQCVYYCGEKLGKILSRPFELGDKIGFGIDFDKCFKNESGQHIANVFITYNKEMITAYEVPMPKGGFYGAVGLHSHREEVQLMYKNNFFPGDEAVLMDSNEDIADWIRLDDVVINGKNLEYCGKAKNILDVGLAQARYPLNVHSHYFEIEIVSPGAHCYIAIGLTARNYPKHRHPGWNSGSIGYHADDGKLFNGSGAGEKFGPACCRGDRMGCGIIFPESSYESDEGSCSDDSDSDVSVANENDLQFSNDDYINSEEGNVPYTRRSKRIVDVQVYFTHNGDMIGERTMKMPKLGFYPTIGMLSSGEVICPILNGVTG